MYRYYNVQFYFKFTGTRLTSEGSGTADTEFYKKISGSTGADNKALSLV